MATPTRFNSDFLPDPQDYSACRSTVIDTSAIEVSAIVSTYNSERFFKGCMEDLTSQSLFQKGKLEILIVDSNSQQNESEILKGFEKQFSNITYLKTKQREPIYKAWNRGIQAASGIYVTNANTDDRHRYDAIETLASTLNENPQCVLAYGDLIVTKNENETYECCSVSQYIEYPDFDPIHQIHFGQCGPQPLWRKSLHQKYGYFLEGFPVCADYEWWLRLARFEKFIHVPELTGLYLDSATSVEHREPEKTRLETETIRNFYAAASNVVLDHERYANRAVQNFYSRHARTRSTEPDISFVLLSSQYSTAQPALSGLYEAALTQRFEVILTGQPDCEPIERFERLSSRLRIRAIPTWEQANVLIKAGLGALHASTSCVIFISDPTQVNSAVIESVSQWISQRDSPIFRLAGTAGQSASLNLCKLAFAPDVFAPLFQAKTFQEILVYMQQLDRHCA